MNTFKMSDIKVHSHLVIESNHCTTLTDIDPPSEKYSIPVEVKQLQTGQAGIYEIRNKTTGWFYIGQTKNLQKRQARHFNDLRQKKHHAKILEHDFFKYGEQSFEFRVILFCRPSELTFYEHILIKYLHPYYNPRW